jgi:hypothetical protein
MNGISCDLIVLMNIDVNSLLRSLRRMDMGDVDVLEEHEASICTGEICGSVRFCVCID